MTRSGATRPLLGSLLLLGTLSFALAVDSPPRQVSFEERVAAHRAIERTYHAHRQDASRPFETGAATELLADTVRKTLAKSLALEHYWKQPVTVEMLEREVERMVRQSRMPGRLAELFEALGNDPILIQGQEVMIFRTREFSPHTATNVIDPGRPFMFQEDNQVVSDRTGQRCDEVFCPQRIHRYPPYDSTQPNRQ